MLRMKNICVHGRQHLDISKMITMFVVQDDYINHKHDQKSKNFRGQTGESPEYWSGFMLVSSCGDPLIFINPKLLKMQDENTKPDMVVTTIEAIDTRKVLSNELTPEGIINSFLLCDEPLAIQNTLDEWFLTFVSTNLSELDQDAHSRHADHYMWLKQLLSDCEKLRQRRVL